MADRRRRLPVLDPGTEETAPCGPKAYVSLEESTILAAIRSLREQAEAVRSQLVAEHDPNARRALSVRLEQLRQERSELVARREQAYVRKMVMLGHLPPEALEPDEV